MSNLAFRDSSVIILETGRSAVRAVYGLHDLLQLPSVDVPARVGIRKNAYGENANGDASSSNAPPAGAKVADYLVGKPLDDALAAGQDLVLFRPFEKGDVADWIQAEAIWKHVLFTCLPLKRAQNESPILLCLPPGLTRASYERAAQIFFERFNVAALSILERPLAQLYAANALSGIVVDIDRDSTDITPIVDGFIQHAAKDRMYVGLRDCEMYLAQLLRANTSVTAAIGTPSDPSTQNGDAVHSQPSEPDLLDLVRHIRLAGLIKPTSSPSQSAVAALASGSAVADLAEPEDGVTDIAAIVAAGKERAVIESATKKRANAKATAAELARAKEIEALDLVTFTYNEKEVTLGKERHRFCDPLWNPGLVANMPHRQARHGGQAGPSGAPMSLQDAVGHYVGLVDVDQRQYVWGGLFVTGEVTSHVKGIGAALQARLSQYILGNPDQQNDVQARAIKLAKVPEYFAEYRDIGDGHAAFLGASIVAKITFNDPQGKNFLNKTDYSAKGPHGILEMSPALL